MGIREWGRKMPDEGSSPDEETVQRMAHLLAALMEEGAAIVRDEILHRKDAPVAIQIAISLDFEPGTPPFLAIATMPDDEKVGMRMARFVYDAMMSNQAQKN